MIAQDFFAATTRGGHLSNTIRCLRVYNSLRGYEINIIDGVCFSIIEIDFLYQLGKLERRPSQHVTDTFMTVPSSLTSEMKRIWNLYSFMYRQHTWLRENEMWLFAEVVGRVRISGTKGSEGLSAFNVGLVKPLLARAPTICEFETRQTHFLKIWLKIKFSENSI